MGQNSAFLDRPGATLPHADLTAPAQTVPAPVVHKLHRDPLLRTIGVHGDGMGWWQG